MGLAYNLETTQNPYLTSGLSNYFVQFPNYLQWRINFTVQGDPTKTAAPNGNVYPGFNGNLLNGQPSADENPEVIILGNPANDGSDPPLPPGGFTVVEELPNCFFTQEQTSMKDDNGWLLRWCGRPGSKYQWQQAIFPTGEYIIRDITFINGYYAIVGSYKARFMGLYNNFVDGNNYGDTWDGFLMMYRAYSDNVLVPFDSTGKPVAINFETGEVLGSNGIPEANTGIGILPMRMPYNILPHDDRTQISDMDDVGLYTVDIWRNSSIEQAPNAPGSQSPDEAYAISLWLGGTQAVGETERGNLDIPYTNVDRLAYAMVGTFANIGYFSTSQYGIASAPVRISQNKRPFVQIDVGQSEEGLGTDNSNQYATVGGTASALIYDTRASDVVILAYGGTKQSLQPTRPDINDNEVGYPLGGGGAPTANQRGVQSLYGAYPPFSAHIWASAAAGGGNQFMYDSQAGGENFIKTFPYTYTNPLLCSTFISNYSWGKCLRNKIEVIGNQIAEGCFTGSLAPGDDLISGLPQNVQVSQINNNFTGPRFFCLRRNLGADGLARGSVGGTEFLVERFYDGYYADYERQYKDVSLTGNNATAHNANYYMKCFYDIQAFNSWTFAPGGGIGSLFESPAFLAGSVWVGTDDPTAPSPNAKVYPTYVISTYPSFYTNTADTQNPIMNMPPLYGRIGSNPAGGEDYALEFAPKSAGGGFGPFLQMSSPPVISFVANAAGGANPGIVVPPVVQGTIKNGGGGSNWTDDATNLKDAYFAFCTVPYEDMGRDYDLNPDPDPSDAVPLIYFYCNNITYDNGEVGTGIFSFTSQNPFGDVIGITFGMFFNGQVQGSTTNPIPLVMPNKWTAKIQQTRTFTEAEEAASKSLAETPIFDAYNISGPEIEIPPSNFFVWEALFGTTNPPLSFRIESGNTRINSDQVIINSRNGEEVGVKGNYPRLGFEPTNETYQVNLAQQGVRTGEAMGAMGWRTTGTDRIPVVLVFDSGEGRFKNPGEYTPGEPNYSVNYEYSNSLQNRGNKFNREILIDEDSTTRIALGCSWDNDRDQWIFLFGNYTSVSENQSVSIVSVSSTFTDTPRFGSAYLDQTQNFLDRGQTTGAPTEFNNLIFKSFPMTNNLDGMMWFGSASNTESGFNYANSGDVGTANAPPQSIYAKVVSSGTIANTLQYYEYASNGNGSSYPGTVPIYDTGSRVDSEEAFTSNTTIWPTTAPYLPSTVKVFNLDGSTGREAFVWVDYILFDGADAVIATKLRERGMKVSIEAVEWFKRKIINSGDLNIKAEEIEMWMRQQQDEFTQMMRDAERMGRVRKKKKQVSAYGLDILDALNTDFEDKEIQEFMQDYLPKSRPPTPEEEMLERQRKGGYSPQSKSYYDEVFEQ